MDEIDKYITNTSSLLEDVLREISISRGSYQTLQDIQSGTFRNPSGLIVPFRLHRFVADHYDLLLLQAYVKLNKKALQSEKEAFTGFSLRVIQELGVTKMDIFFSEQLDEKQKRYAKLILTMLDFILIGGEYIQHFIHLFNEEKDKLDGSGKKIFDTVYQIYSKNNTEVPAGLLKRISQYRTDTLNQYSSKVKRETFIDNDRMRKLTSFWSELLHGNPLMIEQIVNDKFQWSSRLKAILLITSRNVLLKTKSAIKNKDLLARVEATISESENIWKLLLKNWQPSAAKK